MKYDELRLRPTEWDQLSAYVLPMTLIVIVKSNQITEIPFSFLDYIDH